MNKYLFIKVVLSNLILNKLIFKYVQFIHRELYSHKSGVLVSHNQIFKWRNLIKSPKLLASFNYLDQLKQYYSINRYCFHEDELQKRILYRTIKIAIKKSRFQILEYLIEDVLIKGDGNLYQLQSFFIKDFYTIAIKNVSNRNVIDYLYSLDSERELVRWKYDTAFIYSPFLKSIEYCQLIISKLNIQQPIADNNKLLQFLSNCIKVGSVDLVRWAMDTLPYNNINIPDSIWDGCNDSSKTDLLEYMYNNHLLKNTFNHTDRFENAVSHGNIEVLEWYNSKQQYTFTPDKCLSLFESAIDSENIDIIKYLYKKFTQSSLETTTTTTDIEVINWFKLIYDEKSNMLNYAINYRRLEFLKWYTTTTNEMIQVHSVSSVLDCATPDFIGFGYKYQSKPLARMSSNFHKLPIYKQKYLIDNLPNVVPKNILGQCKDIYIFDHIILNHPQFIQDNTIINAARFGYFNLVKQLDEHLKSKYHLKFIDNTIVERLMSLYQESIYKATKNNHIDIIKYLIEKSPISTTLSYNPDIYDHPMTAAAKNGNLDLSKFYQNNTIYKLSYHHLQKAAVNGHLDLVIWMNEIGFKIKDDDTKILFLTIENHHIYVSKYLVENSSKHFIPDATAVERAIRNGYLDLLKLFIQKGSTINSAHIDCAASFGHLEILKYLFDYCGEGGSLNLVNLLANYGHLDIIIYLYDNYGDFHRFTEKTINVAISNSRTDIVEWLLKNVKDEFTPNSIIKTSTNSKINELIIAFKNKFVC